MKMLMNKLPLRKILGAPQNQRFYGAGAIKDEGGSFAQKGASEENAYYYNLQREQLAKLKGKKMVIIVLIFNKDSILF